MELKERFHMVDWGLWNLSLSLSLSDTALSLSLSLSLSFRVANKFHNLELKKKFHMELKKKFHMIVVGDPGRRTLRPFLGERNDLFLLHILQQSKPYQTDK